MSEKVKLTKAPMHDLVKAVQDQCAVWLEIDGLPSPPATSAMLRATDQDLAAAVEDLCRAYPRQMGCERHPAGRSLLEGDTNG